MYMSRAMLHFYGARCLSNTCAMGSVVQRTFVSTGLLLLWLFGCLPSGVFLYLGLPSYIVAWGMSHTIHQFKVGHEGNDNFKWSDEIRWAFWQVSRTADDYDDEMGDDEDFDQELEDDDYDE